jgi:hypothetical protein
VPLPAFAGEGFIGLFHDCLLNVGKLEILRHRPVSIAMNVSGHKKPKDCNALSERVAQLHDSMQVILWQEKQKKWDFLKGKSHFWGMAPHSERN